VERDTCYVTTQSYVCHMKIVCEFCINTPSMTSMDSATSIAVGNDSFKSMNEVRGDGIFLCMLSLP
jgi:hypothetical protein